MIVHSSIKKEGMFMTDNVLYKSTVIILAPVVSLALLFAGNAAGYMSGGLLLVILFVVAKRYVESLAVHGYRK